MIRYVLLSLLVASAALASPKERLSNLVDTLSSSPASLTGNVSVGSDVTLGQSRVQVGPLRPAASLQWRKNQSVGFYLSEEELALNTDGAIMIRVSGINIRVKSIRYRNNGHFEVDLKFPVMERTLERKIAEAVEERYKSKMDLAFRELSQIRRQRNAGDTKNLVNKIIGIFKDPDCDPRIPEVQAYLQKQLNGQLIPLIRQHRLALLRAGIDPQVLNALEG